jgi:hypothetical protein
LFSQCELAGLAYHKGGGIHVQRYGYLLNPVHGQRALALFKLLDRLSWNLGRQHLSELRPRQTPRSAELRYVLRDAQSQHIRDMPRIAHFG